MTRFMTSVFLVVALTACGTVGTIDNESGDLTPTVQHVVSRHDGWVDADPSLGEADTSAFKAQSAAFLGAFNVPAVVSVAPIYAPAMATLDRHDAYAHGLSTGPSQLDLMESQVIRMTLQEANQ